MERENQRVMLSKRLLKESLLRLLQNKEFEKISITELCKESSINRATFYRHYETTRDVLLDIQQDCSQALKQTLQENGLVQPQTPGDLGKITEYICIYLHEHRDLVKTLLKCYTNEDIVKEINDSIWVLSESIVESLERDMDSLRLISTYIGFGSCYLVQQWLMEDIPKTPQEIAELVCSILNFPTLISL